MEEGGIKMPIMVPYTVNGGLVKKFKKRAKECGVEAVFIERTGYSVQNQCLPSVVRSILLLWY